MCSVRELVLQCLLCHLPPPCCCLCSAVVCWCQSWPAHPLPSGRELLYCRAPLQAVLSVQECFNHHIPHLLLHQEQQWEQKRAAILPLFESLFLLYLQVQLPWAASGPCPHVICAAATGSAAVWLKWGLKPGWQNSIMFLHMSLELQIILNEIWSINVFFGIFDFHMYIYTFLCCSCGGICNEHKSHYGCGNKGTGALDKQNNFFGMEAGDEIWPVQGSPSEIISVPPLVPLSDVEEMCPGHAEILSAISCDFKKVNVSLQYWWKFLQLSGM